MATTVTISGTLADCGLESLAPFQPILTFRADRPSISDQHLIATRDVEVVPASDGSWSVQLVPSSQMNPETTYTLRVEWLQTGGESHDGFDVLEKVVIPLSDAGIGELPSRPSEKFWVGDDEPLNPQPGLWWMDTSAYPYVWKEWV